ncbi:MAG: tetratricopeptide repeat protein [Cyanobacteria bacterium HKST-UBA02]|nr:tetratricopeptide repeat protein [Cyanobacteria bacterium HKST-UBA02]
MRALTMALAVSALVSTPAFCLSETEIQQAVSEKSASWMKLRKEADTLSKEGKSKEAIAKLEVIIKERKELGRDTASERMEIAGILARDPVTYDQADKIYKTLLSEREKEYGVDDPQVIWTLREYSVFLDKRGEEGKAAELRARIKEIDRKQMLPPEKEVKEIIAKFQSKDEACKALTELGQKFYDKDRDLQALYCYDQAIKLSQKNPQTYLGRSDANWRSGKDSKAMSDINQAIKLDPKLGKAYFRRAMIWEGREKLDMALADFTKAIECDGNDVESLGARGKLLANLGRKEEAIRDFSRVIEVKPDLTWPFVQRGIVFGDVGQANKAISDFSSLIKRFPRNSDYYELRAGAYEKSGDWKLALADYEEVIRLDPEYQGGLKGKERVLKKVSPVK